MLNDRKIIRVYRKNLDISTQQWFDLLQDNSVFKDNDIALVIALYKSKGCRQTASALARIMGVSSYSNFNLQIGRLGKRIIAKLPYVKFPTREDGTIEYWHITFFGEDAEKKGQYIWELRPELKEAVKKLLATINLKFDVHIIPGIRVIPMNKSLEFNNRSIENVQQEFFIKNLKIRKDCLFFLRSGGINCVKNTLLLFQYNNRIIACAKLIEIIKYNVPYKGIYNEALSIDRCSIQIFDPITPTELKVVDHNFKKFSQAKQSLNINCITSILALISNKKDSQIAEEIAEEDADKLFEGVKKRIIVNAYERSSKARQLCLKKYGYKCCVCEFDFGKFYGEIGDGYIEVHHLKPLNQINEKYQVDPINDLRPVCPNCHAMLHKANLSVKELRNLIK